MIRFSAVIILTSLSLVLFLRDANAVGPKKIAEKGHWAAYTFKEKDGKVCYIASAPSKQRGKYKGIITFY